jgi:hypothetical protein
MAAGIARAQTALANAQSKAGNTEDRLNALVNAVGILVSELNGLLSNATFLSAISKLPHQTTANNTIDTTAGSLSNADRVSINGLVNAVNNLQTNLQSHGFES